MADEYTPTTEQVRETYAALCKTDAAAAAEFDRWFAAHDRETARRAWERAVDCLSSHWEDVIPAAIADLERRNPYREETAP